jgi:hypothetical protein
MFSLRKAIVVIVPATIATLASSLVTGTVRVAYPGSMDCVEGCVFAAGGWPFKYLVDHPGISPVGSVSLLGEDIVRSGALAATFTFWFCAFSCLVWLVGRRMRNAP